MYPRTRPSYNQLCAMAQQRISDGVLPSEDRHDLAAGYGTHKKCRLCEQLIYPEQIEYKMADGSGGSVSFHRACYKVWQVEVLAIANKAEGRAPGPWP